MKRVMTICGAAALLCSCQPRGFVINGEIVNAEGAKVTLVEEASETRLDSATIQNGQFRFDGHIDCPARYLLEVDMNPQDTPADELDPQLIRVAAFYLENSEISVLADAETMPTLFWQEGRTVEPAVIEGSEQEDLRAQLEEHRGEANAKLTALGKRMVDEYYIPLDEGRFEEARKAGIEIARAEQLAQAERLKATLEFVREHPAAAVSRDEISYLLFGLTPLTAAEIDEYLAILAPAWEGTPQFDKLKDQAAQAKTLAVGEPFIDCEFYNLDGEKVKLSSVIPQGRYVMLEFWASWCGPCRGEIPHLKHVREIYPDFDIISISLDDKESEWKRAVEEEKMDWVQLRDEGFMNGHAFNRYGVTGIPCCIVLDEQGHFYKVNMRGAYLDAFLHELYGR